MGCKGMSFIAHSDKKKKEMYRPKRHVGPAGNCPVCQMASRPCLSAIIRATVSCSLRFTVCFHAP